MANWKLPPKEKIYEAFSVIADKRYTILSEGKGSITSSNGKKAYNLEWTDGVPIKITSNDNASYWQGYAGYPIIAMLMALGKIAYQEDVVQSFKQINWNELNKLCNNDYTKVVEKLLSQVGDSAHVETIRESVDNIYAQLSNLSLEKLNKREKPPKETI